MPAGGGHLRPAARVDPPLRPAALRLPRPLARVRVAPRGRADGTRPAALRLVTCHLGAGVSLAAVRDGRSVDTTMGFTPLEGLVMATRTGDVDPGMLLWLQRRLGLTADELSGELTERSGLLGLAGHRRHARGDRNARRPATPTPPSRSTSTSTACAAPSRAWRRRPAGLDALVFTAGVGEHAPLIRQRTADGLGFLGVTVDPARNERGPEDREIGPAGSRRQDLRRDRPRGRRDRARDARGARGDLNVAPRA